MNSQMDRPRGHTSNEDDPYLHDQGTGIHIGHAEEHHGEKKSVLKKVKAKAKKIKDSIKEHVGHGHEVQHDDHDHDHDRGHAHGHGQGHDHEEDENEDDDEMDTDPEIHGTHKVHGTHTAQSSMPGQEGVGRQHAPLERTEGAGTPMTSKPGDYQTFDPTTARYTPGQGQTLDWSRTDTGRPKVSEEHPFAPTHTPVAATHSGGGYSISHGHSTGGLEVGHKVPSAKLGGYVEKPTSVEIDPQAPKDVGEVRHPADYQAKVCDPTGMGHDSSAAQSFMPGQHRSMLGERTRMEGVSHAPVSKPQGDHQTFDSRITTTEGPTHIPANKPQGEYQTFDPSTARYVPGHEETLGWSRTDTGRLEVPEGLSNASKHTLIGDHSSTMEGVTHVQASKPQGEYQTFDSPASHVPGQVETLGWSGTDTGRVRGSEVLSSASKNTPIGAHSSTMEGVTRVQASKPQGGYQTFDPSTASYVPGQEETLGWSRTDTGRLRGSEGQSHASRNTPTAAHSSRAHGTGADEREAGKLGEILGSPALLEKDPRSPRERGENHRAENYESKVTDPTGKGGEEIGVTPILHHLDRMHIHDRPTPGAGQQESIFKTDHSIQDEYLSTGSHNQFSPETVTSKTSTFLEAPGSGFQFNSTTPGDEGTHEQKPGSYTEKISSAAAMMADKAKQATSSVTSKLGYGGSSDQQTTAAATGSHDTQAESVGYGEKISSVTGTIADKAVQAKDAVATKLGYGGTHEEQPVKEGATKGGSMVQTVKEKIAPVYGKAAEVGSTMASKVRGSGTEHGMDSTTTTTTTAMTEPTTGADKGMSMKEYLVEKLKPGEDDKALFSVITEALPLHKRKEDISKVGEEGGGEPRKVIIKGRVTESEEVAKNLGRSEETNYDEAGKGFASPGKGVMDRIKEAAGTWFQKSGEVTSQDELKGDQSSPSVLNKENVEEMGQDIGLQ